jgi:uncharacterized membrane protein
MLTQAEASSAQASSRTSKVTAMARPAPAAELAAAMTVPLCTLTDYSHLAQPTACHTNVYIPAATASAILHMQQ